MKNLLTLICIILASITSFSQSTSEISYQAVLRGTNGQLLTSKNVGVQIHLRQGSASGTVVYTETHHVTTNSNGLMSLLIGGGTPIVSDFASLDWSAKPYFVQIDLDLEGGTNYTTYSTTELASVPYALHATTAEKLTEPLQADQGLEIEDNTVKMVDGVNTNNLKVWDGATWVNKSISITTQSVGQQQPFSIRNPYLGLTYQIALDGIYPSRNGVEPFIGEIILFAGNFDIRGYAFCSGQLLPINQYSALFSILGTNYGGNGQTTFALPDLRGRTPVHVGQGNGLSYINIGQVGGSETATIYQNNLPAHSHPTAIIFSAP